MMLEPVDSFPRLGFMNDTLDFPDEVSLEHIEPDWMIEQGPAADALVPTEQGQSRFIEPESRSVFRGKSQYQTLAFSVEPKCMSTIQRLQSCIADTANGLFRGRP